MIKNYLFLGLILLFSVNIALATDYYVDKDGVHGTVGNDTLYNGTSWNYPFATIQKAADVVSAGSVVTVANGTYTDTDSNYIVDIIASGNATHWITFKSEYKFGAVVDGRLIPSTSFYNDGGVYGNGPYAPIIPEDTNIAAFNIGTGANYIRIENFTIKQFKWGGIWDNSVNHDLYIYGNKINDIGRWCYWSSTESGDSMGQAGVFTGSSSYNITLDSNLVYDIGRLDHIVCDLPYSSHWYSHDQGMYMRATNVTIINNVLRNNTAGFHITIDNINYNIVGNTFYGGTSLNNPEPIIRAQILSVQQDAPYATNIHVWNNLGYEPSKNFFMFYWSNAREEDDVQIYNNLVNGSDYQYLVNYYPLTPVPVYDEANNLNLLPQLINITTYNFHLNSTSPAINNGTVNISNPLYDFEGNLRGSPPDIGAYEYISGNATPTITSYANNYSASTTFSVPSGTSVLFNATASQSVNWTWTGATYISGNGTTDSNASQTFTSNGIVKVNGTNVNGTTNTITWTIAVLPNITSWNNHKTNNQNLTLIINTSEIIWFDVTIDQPITTWLWAVNGSNQFINYDYFVTSWVTVGLRNVSINATNTNGTSQTIYWGITVQEAEAPPNVTTYNQSVYNIGWQIIFINSTQNMTSIRDMMNSSNVNWITRWNAQTQEWESYKVGWSYRATNNAFAGEAVYLNVTNNDTIINRSTNIESYNYVGLLNWNLWGNEKNQSQTLSEINASINSLGTCDVDYIVYINPETQAKYTYTCGLTNNESIYVNPGFGYWANATTQFNRERG